MTDHQREKLEKLIERQIEADRDRDGDGFAFFLGAAIAAGVGVTLYSFLIWLFC